MTKKMKQVGVGLPSEQRYNFRKKGEEVIERDDGFSP